MLRLRRLLRFVCFTGPLGLALVSCAKRETPADEGLRTRTLLVGNLGEPGTLDPQLTDIATDQNLSYALFEGLTVFDEQSALPVPGVAERWEFSPDGLTCTFHLRPNARWSNGDRVTAHDFVFSIQRALSPRLGAPSSYLLWALKNAEAYNTGKIAPFSAVGVAAPNDATLRLTLTRPTPYLPSLAACPVWMPVHRPTVEKFGPADDRGSAWTRPGQLVGNGAFILAEWSPHARIVTAKNPHYWGAAQNQLERVLFFPIDNADTEERNFRAGQLHVTFGLPPSKLPGYRAHSPDLLRVDPWLQLSYLNFNTTRPPLNNPQVRRALSLALDRAAIAQSVYAGARQPADSFTPPNAGAYAPPAGVTGDVAAARRLLSEAGFPGGRGLPPLPILVRNDNVLPKVAEAIQAMWQRELGVRSTIEPVEQKIWIQNQKSLAHTVALLGWTADFPDPITFLDILRAGGGNNFTGWAHPAYDALLDRAAATAEAAARFALLQQAEALMLAEAPVAPLTFGAKTYLVHPAVKNWQPAPLDLRRYQLVRLEK